MGPRARPPTSLHLRTPRKWTVWRQGGVAGRSSDKLSPNTISISAAAAGNPKKIRSLPTSRGRGSIVVVCQAVGAMDRGPGASKMQPGFHPTLVSEELSVTDVLRHHRVADAGWSMSRRAQRCHQSDVCITFPGAAVVTAHAIRGAKADPPARSGPAVRGPWRPLRQVGGSWISLLSLSPDDAPAYGSASLYLPAIADRVRGNAAGRDAIRVDCRVSGR